MTRVVLRGECNRCGGCCFQTITNPKGWKQTQKAFEDKLTEVSKMAGEKVILDPQCGHLRWECPHCHRILSTTPFGYECGKCAVSLLQPTTARCMIYDKRPKGCRQFPANPLTLDILQVRLKRAGMPPCTLHYAEVRPCRDPPTP